VFGQRHRRGEAAQTDFTSTGELAVTIAEQVFVHLLCCRTRIGRGRRCGVGVDGGASPRRAARAVPARSRAEVQTDCSTAATHKIPDGHAHRFEDGKRPFNDEYLAVMRHYGMTLRTTEVGAKEQNGDVEAGHGVLKRRLEQALLVRASRDFESVEAWQAFIDETVRKANATRSKHAAEDLAAMRELDVAKPPEYVEEEVCVSEWSTVRVRYNAYSVPSRLIGEWIRVRIYEDRIEVRYADEIQLACERLRGRKRHRIDYRHVIWSLVRKPGAFARYVYREEMLPSLAFREAYDAIQAARSGTVATSNTCASSTWPRARWRATSSPRSCCSR
jgi:hypothetical protein